MSTNQELELPDKNYTFLQLAFLVILRMFVGYHFLYEGLTKFFNNNWSAEGFLLQSEGFLSEFFHFIAESPDLLNIANYLNIYGQILIGIGLIIGFGTRVASWSGALLLLLYYIANPPSENFVFIDRNMIELNAMLILSVFNTSKYIGVDFLVKKMRSRNNG
ncbi:MAG: DoxX family membrane protein [Melioribacteraceae bacterium]|nr:DoxX family membrane protein [Melioribacteraceae bacterium]